MIIPFNIGDKVRIVKYGSLLWENVTMPQPEGKRHIYKDRNPIRWFDINPELVGKEAVVQEVHNTQGRPKYVLSGLTKVAWYDHEQLEAT